MSELLLIIPPGWAQLDWTAITNGVASMSATQVSDWINSNNYGDMEALLKEAGFVPPDKSIVEAKLIDDTYFIVRLG